MKDFYAYERKGATQIAIYSPDGDKMAEVYGGKDQLKNAKLIVNALNMRHRWLIKVCKNEE